jgi:hypothetical protein
MYQINKRFFIGIGIVEALCLIPWLFGIIGFPIWAAAIITLIFNAIYFISLFVGLKVINKEEIELQNQIKDYDPSLVFKISKEDAKKFKKEGALVIDGKELINKDFKLWKDKKQQL